MKKTLILLSVFISPFIFGQNSVLHIDSTVVTVASLEKMTVQRTVCGTILNKHAEGDLNFVEHFTPGCSLKSFSASIKDASGKVIDKFSLKDVKSTEASKSTADDVTTKYLFFQSNSYPYSIEFSYEMNFTDGFQSIPPYVPRSMPDQKTERAVFTLITPQDYGFSWKVLNCDIQPSIVKDKTNVRTTWVIPAINPLSDGAFTPDEIDILPIICMAPDTFIWEGRKGTLRTIEDYGKWKWNLIEESSSCPEDLKNKVHELTDNIGNRFDKIAALYAYMQKEYRYVSIQLGIGGQKPMSPGEVFTNKFGDCKALTYLMKTMLREIGIESCYVEIGTKVRRQLHEFAFPGFKDHVILKIPGEKDLWIECTSSTLPMGYIHSSISGHECYVYDGGSMHIETVPQYSENENLHSRTVDIKVSEDGSAQIDVKNKYSGLAFGDIFPFKNIGIDDQTKYLKEEVGFPMAGISSVECVCNEDGANSSFEISYSASVPKYASKSGSKVLIPICLPNDGLSISEEEDRTEPYYIYDGTMKTEDITIEIPEGWSFERIPNDSGTDNPFGKCSFSAIKFDDTHIRIHIERTIHKGIYPTESFDDIKSVCEFFQNLSRVKVPLIQSSIQ